MRSSASSDRPGFCCPLFFTRHRENSLIQSAASLPISALLFAIVYAQEALVDTVVRLADGSLWGAFVLVSVCVVLFQHILCILLRPMQGHFPYSVLPFQATSYFRTACWSHGILPYWLFYHVILPYCLPCPWHTFVLQARSTSFSRSGANIHGVLSCSGDWKIDNWSPKCWKLVAKEVWKVVTPPPAQKRWNSRQKTGKKLTLLVLRRFDRSRTGSPCGPTSRVHVTRREGDQQAQEQPTRRQALRRRLCVRTSSSCAVAELLKSLRIHVVDDVKFTAQKKKER